MKQIFAGLIIGLTAMTGMAQSMVDRQRQEVAKNTAYIEIGGHRYTREQADSINREILEYYYDQFRGFQDPEAPYFMFMSKDAQLSMGIGGVVRMRGWYDMGNVIDANGFAPYLIPMGDTYDHSRIGSTPAGTALFFRVLGRNKTLGHYQVYIEANFNGWQARGFNLKKAYAVVRDFTIGYAPSTFGDVAAQSPVLDAQGANNKISNTAVLLRYMRTFKKNWTIAASVEAPSPQIGVDGTTTGKLAVNAPDGSVFVQYGWGPTSHIRLSGTVRSLRYRDMVNNTNHAEAGWGLLLSGVGHPADPVTVYGNLNYGRGTASLGGDLICGNYDLIDNADVPGTMYAPASLGYNIGLQYNFRPNLFVSASFSQTRLYTDHPVAGSEYKYGMWAAANVFWNLTPRIQAGAEFDWGLRCNVDGESRTSKRIGLMCQFSF